MHGTREKPARQVRGEYDVATEVWVPQTLSAGMQADVKPTA